MELPIIDKKARASSGRYYPVAFVDVIHRVGELGIYPISGGAIRLLFCNPLSDPEEGLSLMSFDYRGKLSVFSLPDSVPDTIASASFYQALQMLAEQNGTCRIPKKGNHILLYPIRRLSNGDLVMYEQKLSYQRQKYRGSQKYSNQCKAKVKGVEEKEISRKSM